MANLPGVFNPGEHSGTDKFSAIEGGDYIAQVVESQMKETKAKTGQYLELTWQILAGEYAGRKLWSRLNLVNPNPKAVEIANKHLKTLCDVTGNGAGPIQDSQVLHNKPCKIRVQKKEATAEYPESNEVKNYEELTAEEIQTAASGATSLPAPSAVAPTAAAPAAVAAAAASPAGTPPWGTPTNG